MRILQVTPLMSWTGGVREYVAGVSKHLDAMGHEVRRLTVGGGSPPHPMAADLDIRRHPRTKMFQRYSVPVGLLASIREASKWADVVHAHQPLFVGTQMAGLRRRLP